MYPAIRRRKTYDKFSPVRALKEKAYAKGKKKKPTYKIPATPKNIGRGLR